MSTLTHREVVTATGSRWGEWAFHRVIPTVENYSRVIRSASGAGHRMPHTLTQTAKGPLRKRRGRQRKLGSGGYFHLVAIMNPTNMMPKPISTFQKPMASIGSRCRLM